MKKIEVGCCGPGMALARYQKIFSVLEVQQTFYQPPQTTTLEKWRAQTPDDFEFVLKAWQLITHAATSPTYRRIKRDLTDKEKREAGFFRLTPIVLEALKVTYDCAHALKSKSILFQCPKSFLPTIENQNQLRKFFSSIERPDQFQFYWEPRGEWSPKIIESLCRELKLLHAVDPFVNTSVTPEHLYFRLHGIGGFKGQYGNEQFKMLRRWINSQSSAYVMFNNASMTSDAADFQKTLWS